MGFGHRVYKVKDPRATVLQELAEHVFAETGRPKLYEMAVELERVAAGILGPKGIYPNVDFYSGIVYQALGIPRDLFTPIFAIARVAGWLAHWLEQLQEQPHLPAGADLRRQARRAVCAAGEATVTLLSETRQGWLRWHRRIILRKEFADPSLPEKQG